MTKPPAPDYTYAATVLRVVDGDTIDLSADVGFHVTLRQSFRLAGCNARELTDPGGPEAKANLAAQLPAGAAVTIRSVKPDKYNRFDALVYLPDGTDLIAQLIAQDWLARWDGHGTAPKPPWPRP